VREITRLLDAYQSSVIELEDLKQRRDRISAERAKLAERLVTLRQQQCEREQPISLAATLEEFCRTIDEALIDPSFETKRKILRLVVVRVEFQDDEITIKHLIPVQTVRLQRHQLVTETPVSPRRVDRMRPMIDNPCLSVLPDKIHKVIEQLPSSATNSFIIK
jgi:hypothetical protein